MIKNELIESDQPPAELSRIQTGNIFLFHVYPYSFYLRILIDIKMIRILLVTGAIINQLCRALT